MARALAWHARGHRFDPDILHVSLSVFKSVIRKKIFDILAQAKQVERNRTHPLEVQSPAV